MLIILPILSCFLLLTDHYNIKYFRCFVASVFIIFFSILCFYRPEYGLNTDYFQYYSFFSNVTFNNVNAIASEYGFEYGFSLFIAALKSIISSERFYFSVIAFISLSFAYSAIVKLSRLPSYSFLLFFLSFCVYVFLGQIRQGVSISFGLVAICYFLDRRYLFFLIFLFLAIMFHVTAIILITIPFLKYVNLKVLYFFMLLFFFFIFTGAFKPILDYIIHHINIGSFATGKLLAYSHSEFSREIGFSLIQLYYLSISTIVFFFYRKIDDVIFVKLYKIFLFGVVLNFGLNSFSVLLRATYYFVAFDSILISYLILYFKNDFNRLFFYVIFLSFFILRFSLQWNEWVGR